VITLEPNYERALGVRPSVSAVIFDRRGRLLLQQRSDGGQWGLPGGSVEIGESVRDAVRREVQEETGLTVSMRRLVGVYSEPARQVVRYPDGNVWHYITSNLLSNHRIRVRDACMQSVVPFVR
jgi:ADP-ribose pyrophosphatase YjhB (NUDIX family)